MYSGLSPINACGPVWAGEAPGDILKWAHQIFAPLCDDITAWAHLTQSGPWPINALWPRVSRWSTRWYSRMGPPDLCTVMWRYNRMGPFDSEWSMADKRVVAQSEQVKHPAILYITNVDISSSSSQNRSCNQCILRGQGLYRQIRVEEGPRKGGGKCFI